MFFLIKQIESIIYGIKTAKQMLKKSLLEIAMLIFNRNKRSEWEKFIYWLNCFLHGDQ